MKRRFGLRSFAGLTTLVAALVVVPFALAGAISTTDNAGYSDGVYTTVSCLNGNGTNCNIYQDKRDVWLSGLPISASLGEGDFFLAILDPGAQKNPNDGEPGNLSTSDTYVDRSFHVDANGAITLLGGSTHVLDNGKIQAFPFDDTTNPGGVYIAAVCAIPASPDPTSGNAGAPGVDPNVCKYDAFKVNGGGTTTPPADDLTVTKTATPSFTRTYSWDSAKSLTSSGTVRTSSTTATATYSVTAGWTSVDSAWQVAGTITVTNPNLFNVSGVDVTDAVDNNGTCIVTDGTDVTVPGSGFVTLNYTCSYSVAPSPSSGTNTATATWPDIGSPDTTGTGTATFDFGTTTPTVVNGSETVTDNFNNLGATKIADVDVNGNATNVAAGVTASYTSPTYTFTYSRTLTVNPNGCTTYPNTVAITGLTDPTTGDNSASVTVCPTVNGLTIGYWANKNGQGRISASGTSTVIDGSGTHVGVCTLTLSLRQYAPFQDLGQYATCSQVATYVSGVIKVASCTSTTKTCNSMLKAQMLATALNVYFGVTNGSENIDLVHGCSMLDFSGGTASCNGSENWGPAFNNQTHMTVLAMLVWAASQSNVAGSAWYGQVKATQVLAKDAFDAINNSAALSF